jgi:hypothetical protein
MLLLLYILSFASCLRYDPRKKKYQGDELLRVSTQQNKAARKSSQAAEELGVFEKAKLPKKYTDPGCPAW